MSKHTPGPWEAVDYDNGVHEIHMASRLMSGSGYEPQHCIRYDHGQRWGLGPQFLEAGANALLIAAAPELLEALREALDCPPGGLLQWLERAEAAIAKATGGEG